MSQFIFFIIELFCLYHLEWFQCDADISSSGDTVDGDLNVMEAFDVTKGQLEAIALTVKNFLNTDEQRAELNTEDLVEKIVNNPSREHKES